MKPIMLDGIELAVPEHPSFHVPNLAKPENAYFDLSSIKHFSAGSNQRRDCANAAIAYWAERYLYNDGLSIQPVIRGCIQNWIKWRDLK